MKNDRKSLDDMLENTELIITGKVGSGKSIMAEEFSKYIPIMKSKNIKFTKEKLIESGTVTDDLLEEILNAIKNKKNIVISGGTGSGKTSILEVLLDNAPDFFKFIIYGNMIDMYTEKLNVLYHEVNGMDKDSLMNLIKLESTSSIVDYQVFDNITNYEIFNFINKNFIIVHSGYIDDMQLLELREKNIDIIIEMNRLPGGRRILSLL